MGYKFHSLHRLVVLYHRTDPCPLIYFFQKCTGNISCCNSKDPVNYDCHPLLAVITCYFALYSLELTINDANVFAFLKLMNDVGAYDDVINVGLLLLSRFLEYL